VRKGEALEGLERLEEAIEAFERAVEKGQGTVKSEAEGKLRKLKERIG